MRCLRILVLSIATSTMASCEGRDLDFQPPPVILIRPPLGGIIDSTSGLSQPTKLALAGDTIVFTNSTYVVTIPVVGGVPKPRYIDAPAVGLVADTRFAFWIDTNGVIHALDLAADTMSVVIEGQGQPSGIAIDENNIYWTAGGGLFALPRLAVTSPQSGMFFRAELASAFAVGRVTAGGGSVVFVAFDAGASNGRIVRLPTSGDLPNTVATGAFAGTSVATDGLSAFWTDYRVGQAGLYRAALSGGEVTRLSLFTEFPGDVVVVGTHLYFHHSAVDRITTTGAPSGWMAVGDVSIYAVNERTLARVSAETGGWALIVNTLWVPGTF